MRFRNFLRRLSKKTRRYTKTPFRITALIIAQLLTIQPQAGPTQESYRSQETIRKAYVQAMESQNWAAARKLQAEAASVAEHLSVQDLAKINQAVRKQVPGATNPVAQLLRAGDMLKKADPTEIPQFVKDFQSFVRVNLRYRKRAMYIERSKAGWVAKKPTTGKLVMVYNPHSWEKDAKKFSLGLERWILESILPLCETGVNVDNVITELSNLIVYMDGWQKDDVVMAIEVPGVHIVGGRQYASTYNVGYSRYMKETTAHLLDTVGSLMNELIVAQQESQ